MPACLFVLHLHICVNNVANILYIMNFSCMSKHTAIATHHNVDIQHHVLCDHLLYMLCSLLHLLSQLYYSELGDSAPVHVHPIRVHV